MAPTIRREKGLLATSASLMVWPSPSRASIVNRRQNNGNGNGSINPGRQPVPGSQEFQGANINKPREEEKDKDEERDEKKKKTKKTKKQAPQTQTQIYSTPEHEPSGGELVTDPKTSSKEVTKPLTLSSNIGRPFPTPPGLEPTATSIISLVIPTSTSGGSFITLNPTDSATEPDTTSILATITSTLDSDINSGSLPTSESSSTSSTGTSAVPNSDMAGSQDEGGMSNRTLVITLSTVLSVIGFLLIVGGLLLCWRYRSNHRIPFFSRGITPIDDDEIETWKTGRAGTTGSEKVAILPTHQGEVTIVPTTVESSPASTKGKKPASVIIYTTTPSRISGEGSPRSLHSMHSSHFRKQSIDVPQTPVFAKAPNARLGLCDESLPGADPFVTPLKRQPSRLSKMPPTPGSRHIRSRSSRSSVRSFGYVTGGSSPPDHSKDWMSGYHTDGAVGSNTPRTSSDYFNPTTYNQSHIYSSSSIPPSLTIGDEMLGGLSPPPAVLRNDIGRAIG